MCELEHTHTLISDWFAAVVGIRAYTGGYCQGHSDAPHTGTEILRLAVVALFSLLECMRTSGHLLSGHLRALSCKGTFFHCQICIGVRWPAAIRCCRSQVPAAGTGMTVSVWIRPDNSTS